MCLAVPMKLVSIQGNAGIVELDGVRLEAGLDLIEDAQVGDYLIVHAGYAIQKLDAQEAQRTIELFREAESSRDS
jgi:hydrogenase expression/formation protein HypC